MFNMFPERVYKVISAVGTVVQYACVSNCAFEYIADFVLCQGPSMEPTIYGNSVLLAEHVTPRRHRFTKGDIVIAKCPTDPQQHVCKRITGLPGDKVIFIGEPFMVPRGHVWLEGDNDSNSEDSRLYGPVPQGLIRGRVLCKVWPFTEFAVLTTRSTEED